MGTPTPGTVLDPAKNSPGSCLDTFAGRKGPVWAKVWANANGVPAAMPWASQSRGVTSSSVSTSLG